MPGVMMRLGAERILSPSNSAAASANATLAARGEQSSPGKWVSLDCGLRWAAQLITATGVIAWRT